MNFKDIFSKRISKVEDNFSQDYLDFQKYFLRTFSNDYAIRHTIQVSDFSKNVQKKNISHRYANSVRLELFEWKPVV